MWTMYDEDWFAWFDAMEQIRLEPELQEPEDEEADYE